MKPCRTISKPVIFALAIASLVFPAEGQERKLSLNVGQNEWLTYHPAFVMKGDNLEIVTDAVIDVFLRSKFPLPKDTDRGAQRTIADYVVRFSSVDPLDDKSSNFLLYNVLADIFAHLKFQNGKLIEINFASGSSIARALDIPEKDDLITTLLYQRPHLLAELKKIMKKQDVYALFKKHNFDQTEVRLLADSMGTYISEVVGTADDPCASFARDFFEGQKKNQLPDDRVSSDIRDSYMLLIGGRGGDQRVMVLGDTVVNRARTFLLVQSTEKECKTTKQVTQLLTE